MAFVSAAGVRAPRAPPLRCARRRRPQTATTMTQRDPDELQLPIFNVGATIDLLTPGETRALQLPYGTFHDILSSGSTVFAQVHAAAWARAAPRAALLSIQAVRRVDAGGGGGVGREDPFAPAPPLVTAEVRCTGRADIVGVEGVEGERGGGPAPAEWSVVRGVGRRVCDERAGGIAERRGIAEVEWEAWALCQEMGRLQARLGGEVGGSGERRVPIDQELRVWAPREYDRGITEEEWARTPPEVREVWQARAEALSFAMLRRCASGEECMRRAMEIVRTGARLRLALEELERAKAVALAKLSIDGALGVGEDGSGGGRPGVDGDGV